MRNLYGLIGYPLTHSFSRKYFTAKFQQENLPYEYDLFPLQKIDHIVKLIQENPTLNGLNVTIPYKESVIPFLDKLDETAVSVGAVNVIKINNNKLTGYNSDYYGFETSLLQWIPNINDIKAVVLGSGGASKAVISVLKANNIKYSLVSRKKSAITLSYHELADSALIKSNKLIINTTPLGMAPHIDNSPEIDYQQISENHFIYDLIYNPEETEFLKKCGVQGAKTKNGLEMLELQAEKSWEIWSS